MRVVNDTAVVVISVIMGGFASLFFRDAPLMVYVCLGLICGITAQGIEAVWCRRGVRRVVVVS